VRGKRGKGCFFESVDLVVAGGRIKGVRTGGKRAEVPEGRRE